MQIKDLQKKLANLLQKRNQEPQKDLSLSPNLFTDSFSTTSYAIPLPAPKQSMFILQFFIVGICLCFVLLLIANGYLNQRLEKELVLSNNYTIALSQKNDVETRLHQLIRRVNLYKEVTAVQNTSIEGGVSSVVDLLPVGTQIEFMSLEIGTNSKLHSQIDINSQSTIDVAVLIYEILELGGVEEVVVLSADRDIVDDTYNVLLQINYGT